MASGSQRSLLRTSISQKIRTTTVQSIYTFCCSIAFAVVVTLSKDRCVSCCAHVYTRRRLLLICHSLGLKQSPCRVKLGINPATYVTLCVLCGASSERNEIIPTPAPVVG
ncbi:hypothetical protein C8Q76DRAFT_339808 [Earliella scabrosa]|nr:hypothetical protein C8Q76DRAFT_339808 [Earliella scabrosa]